jgi:hypothetical protein
MNLKKIRHLDPRQEMEDNLSKNLLFRSLNKDQARMKESKALIRNPRLRLLQKFFKKK